MRYEKRNSEIPAAAGVCPNCGEERMEYEYAAFISYRHLPRDQEVAKHVQHAIETFKMPRGVTAQGRSDGRLGKCFRDEDELPASHSLPKRILDALAKSSSLIVVCSLEAPESEWINREVAAFIEMHGRERVFAVLADGSSEESIPPALRTQAIVPGSAKATPANPLAADLRPEASQRKRDETLRIIAAVAGCGYDDLRQRNRSRSMKRTAAIVASALVVITAVIAALGFASTARQDALIAESRQLAAESSQLLAKGDRYGAIEKALQALPQSEASADKPVVPEARAALEDALEINANPSTPWWASYEIETQAPLGLIDSSLSHKTEDDSPGIGAIAVSDTGAFFAISDVEGNVSTYDLLTGKKLADCVMPAKNATSADVREKGMLAHSMATTENYLVVAEATETESMLACFDARTGELVWSQPNAGLPSFNTSYGDDYLSMAFPQSEGGYRAFIMDISTGLSSGIAASATEALNTSTPYFNTPGARLGTNYAAFGDKLFAVELDSGESRQANLAYANATSLRYLDGIVIATSADPMPTDDISRRFAIESFDENLTPLWRYDGTFASEMIVDSGITSLLAGEPFVYDTAANESGSIVVSAGKQVLVLDSANGAVIEQLQFDRTVASAFSTATQDDPGLVTVACCDGAVSCTDLLDGAQDAAGDARRLALPFPIRWAHITICGDYQVLLAVPADADNRIVSYRTNWSRGEDSGEDYTLDELIELAHEVLAEGGRT